MPYNYKKRVLLDTNVYGLLIERGDARNLEILTEKGFLDVYGSEIIRKELRSVPKNIKNEGRNFRIILLTLYDGIVKDSLRVTKFIEEVADQYFRTLQSLQPNTNKEMIKDLIIVATASANEMDIVVSDYKKTMLSPNAIKAYEIVSKIRKLRMPEFVGYEKFTRLFSL